MSRHTKQKHFLLEDEFKLPTEKQQIVKFMRSQGSNLHTVQDAEGESYLVSMPKRLRGSMWLIKGIYLLVEPIAEGNKVKAEIVKILTSEHVRYFKECDVWPAEFSSEDNGKVEKKSLSESSESSLEDSDEEEDSDDEDDSDDEEDSDDVSEGGDDVKNYDYIKRNECKRSSCGKDSCSENSCCKEASASEYRKDDVKDSVR